MPPWGANIFSGLIPPDVPTDLSIRLIRNAPSLPNEWLSLAHFAEIRLEPSPPLPFNPKPHVCFTYTAADVLRAGGHAENLFLAHLDPNQKTWRALPTVLDRQVTRLSAPTSRFQLLGFLRVCRAVCQ